MRRSLCSVSGWWQGSSGSLRAAALVIGFAVAAGLSACSPDAETRGPAQEPGPEAGIVGLAVSTDAAGGEPQPDGDDRESQAVSQTSTVLDSLNPLLRERLLAPSTPDFEEMAEQRIIRFLTVFTPQFFFLDGARQRGISAELAAQFEAFVNERLGRRRLQVQVFVIPVTRDQLIPLLVEGRGDIAGANLTITSERLREVDFSDPFLSGVSEIVVTGPESPEINSLDDLSGHDVHVRRSSSYWDSLQQLNASLAQRGLAPVNVVEVDEFLEDDEILELVAARDLGITVVDSHQAEFWVQVFPDLVLHADLAVRSSGEIAWAFRKNSPELEAVVNDFVRQNKVGTLMGNIMLRRYLQDTKYVRARTPGATRRLEQTGELFKQYGEQYGLDWLLLAAQGYQESRLDQSMKSDHGAVGIMQILPSSAAQVGVSGIDTEEGNIHAGAKYLRYLMNTYFEEPDLDPIDQQILAIAGYNAGPNRINRLRRKAAEAGYDPNRWWNNVELLAAREIGSETVRYVGNIGKYYMVYRLIADRLLLKERISEGQSRD
jgi:membrane-bound lytic murein transglycosylase MltF